MVVFEKKHKYYICKCECGNEKSICYTHLSSGKILSCGCLRKELDIAKRKKDAASRYLYRHSKQNAKYNKKEFDLSYEEFLDITSQNCFYCGKKPLQKWSNKSGSSIYVYNGIDRRDNSKGYNKNNIVPCCSDCNYFKSNIDYNKFLNLVKRIYKHKFGGKYDTHTTQ